MPQLLQACPALLTRDGVHNEVGQAHTDCVRWRRMPRYIDVGSVHGTAMRRPDRQRVENRIGQVDDHAPTAMLCALLALRSARVASAVQQGAAHDEVDGETGAYGEQPYEMIEEGTIRCHI